MVVSLLVLNTVNVVILSSQCQGLFIQNESYCGRLLQEQVVNN